MKKAVYYFGTPNTSEKLASQLNAWQRDSFYDNNKELVHDYLMLPFYGEE